MRHAFVLGLLICVGCRVEKSVDQPLESSNQAPELEPQPIVSPVLPCTVELGPEEDPRLRVAGEATSIEFDFYEDTRLVAYPAGAGEMLVAVGHGYPWYPDRTSNSGATLWRVRCTEPSKIEPAIELQGAEFPWSVLGPDGKHIYFTYEGVHSYEIATGKVEPIIAPRRLGDCWEFGDVDSNEFVSGWQQSGELLVLSGGPCGFEAQWLGELQVVTDFDDPKVPAKRRPRAWVGALAAGAGDRAWVGSGGECLESFADDRYGKPGIWRSDDAGASWTHLPLEGVEAGIAGIWPSPTDPDRVLAATECCFDIEECLPGGAGRLYLTTDGGQTWKAILDESENYGIWGLLVDEANHEMTAYVDGGSRVTRDDGGQWKKGSAKLEKREDTRAPVEVGGFVLEPTEDGLRRRKSDAAPQSGEIVLRPGG